MLIRACFESHTITETVCEILCLVKYLISSIIMIKKMQMLYSTPLRANRVITRLQINNQNLSLSELMIYVSEMQYSSVLTVPPPHPSHPQKPKNQLCVITLNTSLSLTVNKLLIRSSMMFCIALVRIQLFVSLIWQQHCIQRMWLYPWKIVSFALC